MTLLMSRAIAVFASPKTTLVLLLTPD